VQPEWKLYRDVSAALQSGFPLLFIAAPVLKKQICIEGAIYDLRAFIEKRPDFLGVNYVAYVKVSGNWYQCDDDRITRLRSDAFGVALRRGVLAYYQVLG
jgi:ubiquitin C-terminal hydrolase